MITEIYRREYEPKEVERVCESIGRIDKSGVNYAIAFGASMTSYKCLWQRYVEVETAYLKLKEEVNVQP